MSENRGGGHIQNLFYEISVILISKQDKDIIGKGSYRILSLMNIDRKILNILAQ